jgi:hypothetical protein
MFVIAVFLTAQPAHYAEFLPAIIANTQTLFFKKCMGVAR